MNVEITAQNMSAAVIKLTVPLNSAASVEFEKTLGALTDGGVRQIVADLSSATYISSEGIGSIIFAQKKLSSLGGSFAVYGISEESSTLLKILGIFRSINITDSLLLPGGISSSPHFEKTIDESGNAFSESAPFESPLIIECSQCSSLTRVHKPGDYICPTCRKEFTVEEDGTVIF